jgi:phosphomannomutase
MAHPLEDYIRYSLKAADIEKDSLRGLSVVLDALNGAAGAELMRALTIAGVNVIPHRIVPDGNFPSGSPNPTAQNKMDETIKIAEKQNADVVIGLDGDGDRIVFGDKQGLFNAGFVMIPILETLIKTQKKAAAAKILYDPKVNPLALKQWGALNVEPLLFRNGHSQIKEYMKQIGALAGAEESGHFYHQLILENLRVSGENSLLTILLFLNSIYKEPELLEKLRKMQNQVFTSGEFNYVFPSDEIRDKAMEKLILYFKNDGAKITSQTADGIDLQGNVIYNGVNVSADDVKLTEDWYSGYIRIATNEKGVVRSYISTEDRAQGEKIVADVRRILEKEFKGKVID